MDQWIELRRKIRNQDIPLRQLERETGIGRQTLRKIRDNSHPPGYRRTKPIDKPKISPYLDRIKALIKSDKQDHKKQYYTAKKILEILQSEGFTGGYTIVKDAIGLVSNSLQTGKRNISLMNRSHSKMVISKFLMLKLMNYLAT